MRARCEVESFEKWRHFVAEARNSPEAMEAVTGVPAAEVRAAARLYATGGNGAIYYGLGVTEHSQGSTMVMGIANLAMATGNVGRRASASIRCAARTTCRAPATWAPSRTSSRATATSPMMRRARCSSASWEREAAGRAGPAHPEHVRGGARRRVQGPVHPGRGHRAVRSEHAARDRGAECDGMHHRPGPVPERNRQVRARVPARLLVPGKGRHLHQCRAAHLAGAQGDALEVRLRRLGDHAAAVQRAGLSDELRASERDHGRDRRADADLYRRELREAR